MLSVDEQMKVIASGAAQIVPEAELRKKLERGVPLNIKLGVDPTSPDLHLGHAVPLRKMRQFQDLGHKVTLIIGNGTALIGDPSGKTDMRKMMTVETIDHNVECIKQQMSRFLDFSDDKAIIVNNADWLRNLNFIEFMRDIGAMFSVNKMLTADCYKTRMATDNGLSFLEFTYMLMQSYDFLELFHRYGCRLEMGGNDQWSNMLGGTELIRRKLGKDAHAMTITLLLNSEGKKMGKTASGAVWLDPNKTTPFDFYTKEYEKGLQLYSSGVLIMDKCADLLPEHFRFVKGVVDSQDFSLNISREMLQHTRQLKVIAGNLEKKIKSELLKMQKDKREDYEKFWAAFGRQIKYGAYVEYGAHKELLQDLLMYHSSTEDKLVSLAEYASRMKEDQKYIYYACGETIDKIKLLPVMETLSDKGYEVLCMDDSIDEFCVKMLAKYNDKEFKSIADADLGLDSEDEKEEIKKLSEDNKDVLEALGKALEGKVKKVELTSRLKSHPCCLRAEGPVTLEMEKVLNQQAAVNGGQSVHAERVLELNAEHPIFKKLCALQAEGSDKVSTYADILYTQALLIEGMPVDDPVAYANAVCNLLS